MELKDLSSKGTKALGAARASVANLAFVHLPTSAPDQAALSPENVRVFTHSDLANLTFHQVAREGDVMLMEKLLERISQLAQRKKRLNQKDDSKLTPMHYAARYNHYHMIEYLIKNGASVQVKGEDDATPLHFIAKYKKKKAVTAGGDDESSSSDEEELPPEESFSCLKLIVQHGAQVNAKDAMGLTPLHQACTRGNTKAVRELLECQGLALEMTDHQGMTALHIACLYGHKSIVKLLIEEGSNLRCRDKDATTPLHLACAEGSKQIAEMLLNKADAIAERAAEALDTNIDTANSNKNNNDGKPNHNGTQGIQSHATSLSPAGKIVSSKGSGELLQDVDGEKNLPLHLAIENGHLSLVEFCIERAKAASLNNMVTFCRSRDDSCLHLAVQSNNLDIVKLLLDEGADINARNSSLVTPLFLACQHNSHVIVKHLLENGANVEMKDSDFMSPLLISSRFGHLETLTWLLHYHADVTETDKDDRTCIMWAAEEDRSDALKLLLHKNKIRLMIEERDKYNNTALHLASVKGHQATVKLLLSYRAAADIKNDDDRTTLHMAALHGHDAIIPDLIQRDRSIINSGDEESNTALHLASIGGNLKLIQLGANIEMRNSRQWTPLDCAAAFGWVKAARALLEAGASIQPKGKIKICAMHLASQRGHVEVINLLLQWKADVTFRSADGRNALDYAIDFSQKDCVLALIKHETWQSSLKNTVVNPVTGRMTTPMRKLIRKMEDMAEIVCNQCITDNGKKPEDDTYAITLLYEFFDDMYASTEWQPRTEAGRPTSAYSETAALTTDDYTYQVYDEHNQLTKDAVTYDKDSDVLQSNHPLKIMVASKCETLLLHPIVTGLLNYKWRRYGRYVYYLTLIIYVAYLVLLNTYMMLLPPFYQLDWIEMINFQKYMLGESTGNVSFPVSNSRCFFYRSDVTNTSPHLTGCQVLSQGLLNLRWVIFAFSILNLSREAFQLLNQRLNYIDFTNLIEVTLYVLSLLLTIDFTKFTLDNFEQLTGMPMNASDQIYLNDVQGNTGLRQEWQQEIGAFAVFLSWMGLLLFIQKIPRLGIFVVMFTDILKTFGQFFLVFVFFILGFALAFTILLGNQHQFTNWYESLLTTTVMMIGELDYSDKFFSAAGGDPSEFDYSAQVYTRQISFVLFVIFLIVMTIIIMNLLVGLAVGDIIQVQEHATLERLGMQVDLALEVEFTIPAFLRKKFCLRKQTIEINKYRKSNFIKRFLFEDEEMSVENISKTLDKEVVDQDENRTATDRVIHGLSNLRGRMNDLLVDQTEIKQNVRSVRSLVRDVRNDTRVYAEELKENLSVTGHEINRQIDATHTGMVQTTQLESHHTRGKVDDTKSVVAQLQQEVENTKAELQTVKHELEHRLEAMQEALVSRSWQELEAGLQRCYSMVEKSRQEIMENLEEMKIVLVKEKYMSNV